MRGLKAFPVILLLNVVAFGILFLYGTLPVSTSRSSVLTVYQTNYPGKLDISKLQESRCETSENECKDCGAKDVPSVIIQYGPPRTSTTLQFQILCVMMAMLHEHNGSSVGCYFHEKLTRNYFHEKTDHNFTVIKTHEIDILSESLPQNVWIFMTSRAKRSKTDIKVKQYIKQHNRIVRLTVDTDMVLKRGHFIAYDYQSIFGLTDAQMTYIVTYLRYWDILRRCCGKQMSADWRNHLSPIPRHTPHYNRNDTGYPACEMYNISEVESLFINTNIYKRFESVKALRDTIGKPSIVDGDLNGDYCERCNRNIAKRGLHKINDDCS